MATGVIADRQRRPRPTLLAAASAEGMPVAAPSAALSSSWYCVMGAGPDASVVLANPTGSAVTGQVTVFGVDGAKATSSVLVPAQGSTVVKESTLVHSQYVAALVDLDAGQVAAEQTAMTGSGLVTAPCSSVTSQQWYFAEGSTAKDDSNLLGLFNPFPQDAIVDLSFITDEGLTAPADFQGIVVPANGLLVKDVAEHVRRREHVATIVAVRTGRLTVSRLQSFGGGGRKGLSLTLGAPSLGDRWLFPDGYVVDGVSERLLILNPNKADAEVQVEVRLDRGEAEPFDLTVRAGSVLTLDLGKEPRIPKGDPHATSVRTTNGVRVAVERSIDSVSPASHSGFAATFGARRTAKRWLVVAGGPSEKLDEWVAVSNPTSAPVRVSMYALAGGQLLPVEGLSAVEVPARGRRSFRLGDHLKRADTSLLVDGEGQVVVERTLYAAKGPGLSTSIGVPLG
jgi:hypothetical protein